VPFLHIINLLLIFNCTSLQPVPVTPATATHITSTDSSTYNSTNTSSTTLAQNQPPKSQPFSENNSPETSPSLQRVTTASRSKSTSSIPQKALSSTSNSNGFGEFVHHVIIFSLFMGFPPNLYLLLSVWNGKAVVELAKQRN
jgi:hypothetical protein